MNGKLLFILVGSVLFLSLFSFQTTCMGQDLIPEKLKSIETAYGCDVIHGNDYDKHNARGTPPPFYWGVVKGVDPGLSVAFWCAYKESGKNKNKIIIHVDKSVVKRFRNEHAFSDCPTQITTDVTGPPTGVWVEYDSVYTGFEDGIYYFCKDGKWHTSAWH